MPIKSFFASSPAHLPSGWLPWQHNSPTTTTRVRTAPGQWKHECRLSWWRKLLAHCSCKTKSKTKNNFSISDETNLTVKITSKAPLIQNRPVRWIFAGWISGVAPVSWTAGPVGCTEPEPWTVPVESPPPPTTQPNQSIYACHFVFKNAGDRCDKMDWLMNIN